MGKSHTEKNPGRSPLDIIEQTLGIDTYRTTIKSDDGHTIYGYGRTSEVSQKDASEKLSETRDNSDSDDSSGGCFLTTACVFDRVDRSLPDDCVELTTLRNFRDGYLSEVPNGKELINRYYRIAPSILSAIERRPDRPAILDEVYSDLVLPCVALILTSQNEKALELYQTKTEALAARLGLDLS